ncbi:MAG: bifunctional diaminohydroxyphosphoribosylaminopyrimidine deaminase/5-amino-6-(5-phosphoribosylamino)uracil reductase RibD, partial [Dehalococcoidia bacterium]
VGAVIVKDGVVVGEGGTKPPGQAHAEVVALEQAGEAARGATMYVSLEPCCFTGRTPPCTRAIMDAGVAEVHVAASDPNPQVSGGGIRELKEAGIGTFVGEREKEARRLNEAYSKYITTGRPFVTAKFAASLDGKIATRSGDSKWITGEEARQRAHGLRCIADAVVVGVNTVLRDDPRLTARDSAGVNHERQPVRVVVDSEGRMPPEAQILKQPGQTLLAVARIDEKRLAVLEEWGAEVAALPSKDGRVDLGALMELLGQRECAHVLVEGGGTLLGSLFDEGLVDKVVAFVASAIIGGNDAPGAIGGLGAGSMAEIVRLREVEMEQVGSDIMITGYP